jgi:hypothetical protein
MSMEDFDLDIESYSLLDLLDYFNVPKTANKEQLLNNYNIKKEKINKLKNEKYKKDLSEFLEKAYDFVKKYFNFPEPAQEKQKQYNLQRPNYVPNEQQVFYTKQNYRVNPIEREEIKQVISIDSTFRENPSTTNPADFTISLPMELDNVTKMKLISAEIPYTFYFISEKKGNNTFTITVKDASNNITENYTFTIPDGSWTSDNFETMINLTLDNTTTGSGLVRYLAFNGFSTLYADGKSIFRIKTNTEITDISLNTALAPFIEYSLSVDKVTTGEISFSESSLAFLGFTEDQLNKTIIYTDTLNVFFITYNGVLRANSIYGDGINNYIFVCIDDYVGNNKDQIISCLYENQGYLSKNILGRIQIKTDELTTIMNNNDDFVFKERNYFGNVNIRKLRITLLDKFGKVLELNGVDVSLALEFTQQYSSKNQNNFNMLLDKNKNLLM